MSTDHERIEELLAGYALRALEGDDATEADRILIEHVPTCISCRATLEDFGALVGDLALAAPPVAVPDLLLPSIRRRLPERPRRSARMASAWVAAAAMVAVLALAGWNVLLNQQASTADRRSTALNNMVNTLLKEDGSQMVTLQDDADATGASPTPAPVPTQGPEPRLLVSYQPGAPHGWVLGLDIPRPTAGQVYQLWLGRGGVFTAGPRFVPDEVGAVRVFVGTDLSQFDQITVTQEPAQIVVIEPDGTVLWGATMTPAAP